MLIVRDALEQDRNFILDSFRHEYRDCPFVGELPSSELTKKMVTVLTSKGPVPWNIKILCDDEFPDEIYAYVIYCLVNPPVVPWLHVKGIYRGQGFGKQLLTQLVPKGVIQTPFLVPGVAPKFKTWGYQVHFRPYLPEVITLNNGVLMPHNA